MLGMDLICTVLLSPMLCEYNVWFFSVSDAETWRRGRRQIRSQVCRRLPCCAESWSDFLYFPYVLGPIWSDGRWINGFFDKLLFNSSLFASQGSRFTFQAAAMDGEVSATAWAINFVRGCVNVALPFPLFLLPLQRSWRTGIHATFDNISDA